MKRISVQIALLAVLLATPTARAQPAGPLLPAGPIEDGGEIFQRLLAEQPIAHKARNVILFIGDGMGVSTVTAARIYAGQLRGVSGEENALSFERFPYSALIKTYNTDAQIPDSAGTMSAIMTGRKVRAGTISVSPVVARGEPKPVAPYALPTLLEMAEDQGLATGVVSTARVTHATPAACYAHSSERNWESDGDLPASARKQGVSDIARQLIEFSHGDGLDVVLGGGRSEFLPRPTVGSRTNPQSSPSGDRRDGRDLTREWIARPGARYAATRSDLRGIDPTSTRHLLGLFAPSHLAFVTDSKRTDSKQPSLAEMTSVAIDLLQENKRGYFLMVESGRIDHAHHINSAYRALHETIELSKAVRAAVNRTNPEETLIVVTADHSHGLTLAGPAPRGNPVLGRARTHASSGGHEPELARDRAGHTYTTLSYANGPGATTGKRRKDPENVDTRAANYVQEALVPLRHDTHSGEDVPLYARGPRAQLFRGVLEQHAIFHILEYALFETPPRK